MKPTEPPDEGNESTYEDDDETPEIRPQPQKKTKEYSKNSGASYTSDSVFEAESESLASNTSARTRSGASSGYNSEARATSTASTESDIYMVPGTPGTPAHKWTSPTSHQQPANPVSAWTSHQQPANPLSAWTSHHQPANPLSVSMKEWPLQHDDADLPRRLSDPDKHAAARVREGWKEPKSGSSLPPPLPTRDRAKSDQEPAVVHDPSQPRQTLKYRGANQEFVDAALFPAIPTLHRSASGSHGPTSQSSSMSLSAKKTSLHRSASGPQGPTSQSSSMPLSAKGLPADETDEERNPPAIPPRRSRGSGSDTAQQLQQQPQRGESDDECRRPSTSSSTSSSSSSSSDTTLRQDSLKSRSTSPRPRPTPASAPKPAPRNCKSHESATPLAPPPAQGGSQPNQVHPPYRENP